MSQRTEIRDVDVDHPDAHRLRESYFDELRSALGGFAPPSADELRRDGLRGVVLVAYDGDSAVACGSLRLLGADTAEVKRMFVVPGARGRGHGRTLLHALEERARAMDCRRIVLDTAAPLEAAASLYLASGYVEVPRYNDNPHAARWFEKHLSQGSTPFK